jgi:hypothetical protein
VTALLVAENVRTPDIDPHSSAQRAQWERAGRDLDDARRHCEIAAGLLRPLLRADLIEAFGSRWLHDALSELDRLDAEGELPRGAR